MESRQRKFEGQNAGCRDLNADEVCSANGTIDDPRAKDEYMKRFFFRQRADSLSQYPPISYR